MKTARQVSPDKLRGGFYTPPGLVRVCLDRARALAGDRRELAVLEPSAGDGAFVRGLAGHPLASQVRAVTAIEVAAPEAARCAACAPAGFELDVVTASVLDPGHWRAAGYDVAVGNPPFVRFQFVPPADVAAAGALARRLGVSFAGVSNLWLPVFLAALAALRDGGAFAFVVPAEVFTGVSANVARRWLASQVSRLTVDLFPAGSFPRVMQEVVVVSGVVDRPACAGPARPRLALEEHDRRTGSRRWSHDLDPARRTWTAYLLEPGQLAALSGARALAGVRPLAEIAKFEVATVTGANEFFTVSRQTVERYQLGPWALPMLPRVRHAPGLRFTCDDFAAMRDAGARAYLLSFAANRPDPAGSPAAGYLRLGERAGLAARYKCRIRSPWYRVPVTPAGSVLLSKRSHWHPRVILNCAQACSTDTVYRGRMLPAAGAADLVAAFHNSLTLLTAEIEGRSFGGGVLELVPSEVGQLLVAVPPGFGAALGRLDELARSGSARPGAREGSREGARDGPEPLEPLIAQTDRLLAKHVGGLTSSVLDQLAQARLALLRRRMERCAPPGQDEDPAACPP